MPSYTMRNATIRNIRMPSLPLSVSTAFTPYIPLGKGGRSKGMQTIICFGQIRSDLPPHPPPLGNSSYRRTFLTPLDLSHMIKRL
jgi:hypothetical protein